MTIRKLQTTMMDLQSKYSTAVKEQLFQKLFFNRIKAKNLKVLNNNAVGNSRL